MVPLLIFNGVLLVVTSLLLLAEKFLMPAGECEVVINKDKILKVKPGKSVLNYLVGNKIFIPSACGGKSTCGYCKIKVLSGGGTILPTEEVFINRKEKLSGIRLACQVKVRQNIEIYIPEHLLGAQEFKAKVIKKEDLTHDIKLISLKLEDPPNIKFKPGQYIQFKVPDTDEFRAYSIATPPQQENIIELIVRLVPNGLCSTYIHEVLEVNDEVIFTGPFGDFYLKEDSSRNIIAIAGGCGMA
ncbi:MAG: FAD-binding oxidoreductase, partial [Candidatus Omnitrophica bacterium]|nr:FAD-binding oxidoreductase [Candidatus Omnitrophota bacterium]